MIKTQAYKKIHPPNNTFIQFVCYGDHVRNNVQEADRNSVYTKHLLKSITKKTLNVREMFRRIADDGYRESNGKQKPLSMIGLFDHQEIYLNDEIIVINSRLHESLVKTRMSKIRNDHFELANNHFLDGEWHEKIAGSFTLAKNEQAKLKSYYDSFPNIEELTSEQELHVNEAEEFTKSIFHNLPSGDATERNTACHVVTNLLASYNMPCLFFDSTHGRNLHDASSYLIEIDLDHKPFVLKLSSSEGSGGCTRPKTQQREIRFVQTLRQAVEQRQYHSVFEDIRERLSKAYETDKKNIVLTR